MSSTDSRAPPAKRRCPSPEDVDVAEMAFAMFPGVRTLLPKVDPKADVSDVASTLFLVTWDSVPIISAVPMVDQATLVKIYDSLNHLDATLNVFLAESDPFDGNFVLQLYDEYDNIKTIRLDKEKDKELIAALVETRNTTGQTAIDFRNRLDASDRPQPMKGINAIDIESLFAEGDRQVVYPDASDNNNIVFRIVETKRRGDLLQPRRDAEKVDLRNDQVIGSIGAVNVQDITHINYAKYCLFKDRALKALKPHMDMDVTRSWSR